MLTVTRPTPSHFGIFATDTERMVAFYTEVFGLTITDRGRGRTFQTELIFMSASPDQHHQLVIAGGRPKEATFSTVMQISFVVPAIQSLRDIRASGNTTTVLMLTVMDDNDHVFQAICEGASGYLLKQASPAKILDAVREASTGGAPMSPSIATKVLGLFSQQFKRTEETEPLTEREKDVLARLVDGHSYKTAAAELGMGIETLRYHIKNIYSKLHVNSKSEAVLKATRNRMI